MPTYYAITRRNGRWQYVYSGADPESVYRHAADIIEGQYALPGDEGGPVSPVTEHMLDALRVVPEVIAREQYCVSFARVVED